jgi:hypothetical protein
VSCLVPLVALVDDLVGTTNQVAKLPLLLNDAGVELEIASWGTSINEEMNDLPPALSNWLARISSSARVM